MAEVKITALPAYADPASTDVLPIVDVVADLTKKVSIADLLENAGTGSASAPSFAFDGDSNTGMYRSGADALAFSTGGTGRLFIDSSGRLGIGTSTPAHAVHIAGATTPELIVEDTTNNVKAVVGADNTVGRIGTDTNHALTLRTNDTERLRIDSSGRVGIGTSSPGANFHVQSSGATEVRCVSSGDNALFSVQNSGGVPWILTQRSDTSNAFSLRYAGNNYVNVDTSGRVGIGTASPGRELEVYKDAAQAAIAITASTSGQSSLYFADTADSNIGAISYTHSDNALSFRVNDGERARIDNSGRLGIGSSDPADKLEVAGDIRLKPASGANTLINFEYNNGLFAQIRGNGRNGSPLYGDLEFWTKDSADGAPVERMVVSADGNVGIGTSSPGYELEIGGSSNIQLALTANSTVGNSQIYFGDSADDDAGAIIYRHDGNSLAFTVNANERLRIDSSGNVGIGTTNPTAPLSVVHSAGNGFNVSRNNGTISINANYGGTGDKAVISTTTDLALAFHINGDTERARIDSSGRLLVGTSSTSSGARIVVQGVTTDSNYGGVIALKRGTSPGTSDYFGFLNFADDTDTTVAQVYSGRDGGTWSGSSKPSKLVFTTTADGASSPTERMRITQTGYTTTYSTSAGYRFGVSAAAGTSTSLLIGTNSATGVDTGTVCFRVWSNGNVENTNNSYGAISDIKLKENIVDANSQWDDIKALQVRNYNFKEGQTHTQLGLIAQEVELVSPGLVSESPDRDEDGNDLGTVTKSVNYSVLYMKAVKALQEAIARIETLEQRLTDAGL